MKHSEQEYFKRLVYFSQEQAYAIGLDELASDLRQALDAIRELEGNLKYTEKVLKICGKEEFQLRKVDIPLWRGRAKKYRDALEKMKDNINETLGTNDDH